MAVRSLKEIQELELAIEACEERDGETDATVAMLDVLKWVMEVDTEDVAGFMRNQDMA